MKKNFIDYLATALLIMVLSAQVMHTRGLYLSYTKLSGTTAELMAYFISITIEMLVVVFVFKGYRSAGAWFAIFLFFVGILFNKNWDGIEVYITLDPFAIQRFYFPTAFISSTLIQLMCSIGIWYLTEAHAKNSRVQEANSRIQALYSEEQTVNSRIQELKIKEQEVKEFLQTSTKEVYRLNETIQALHKEKQGLSSTLTEWQEEINSLKKAKPRFTQKDTGLHNEKSN